VDEEEVVEPPQKVDADKEEAVEELGQKPRMDAHILSLEAYVTHLHSQLRNDTYPGSVTNTRNARADSPVKRRVGEWMCASSLPRPFYGNCTGRPGRNLPVAVDLHELDVCEDGTYANLLDGDEDATGNPRAIVT